MFNQFLFFDKGGEECAAVFKRLARNSIERFFSTYFLSSKSEDDINEASLVVLGDRDRTDRAIKKGLITDRYTNVFVIDHVKGLHRCFSDLILSTINECRSVFLVPTEVHKEAYIEFGFAPEKINIAGAPALGSFMRSGLVHPSEKAPVGWVLCDEILHRHYEGEQCSDCSSWLLSNIGEQVLAMINSDQQNKGLPIFVRRHPRNKQPYPSKLWGSCIHDITHLQEIDALRLNAIFVGCFSMFFLKARAIGLPTRCLFEIVKSQNFVGFGLDKKLLNTDFFNKDIKIKLNEINRTITKNSFDFLESLDTTSL